MSDGCWNCDFLKPPLEEDPFNIEGRCGLHGYPLVIEDMEFPCEDWK